MEVAAEEESLVLLSRVLRVGASEGEDEDRMALQRLIHLARSSRVRVLLAAHNAVPSLLSLIDLNSPSYFLLLKLLRNLCAGDPSNQEAFSRNLGAQSVALVVDKALNLPTQRHTEMASILQVCLQLLGNACGGGKAEKEAVWGAFFPDRFRALALVIGQEKVLEPLCMVLYTCSHGETHRSMELCHGAGALLLSSCLQAAASPGLLCNGASDWIYRLILDLCLGQPLLPLLFENLGARSKECIQECLFSEEQVTLLGYLLDILSDEAQAHGTEIDLLALIEFLAQTLRVASHSYRGTTAQPTAGSPYAIRPCGIPAIDVVGYTLELFKILSGWEDDNQGGGGKNDRSSIVAELLRHDVIKLCMELLECLGPPEPIHQAMQGGNADLTAEHGDRAPKHNEAIPEGSGLKADQAEEPSKATRATLPYQGYRRDLVAVVGNASHQSHVVQDEVRNLGGLFLILQQCVVDEGNPYLREWGLWAIRNLVDGNMENCKEIAQLQLKGSLTPVELAQMGYKVEMDLVLGRPKLVNGRD